MGCDIHLVIERRKDDGTWLGVWTSGTVPATRDCEWFVGPEVRRRWYSFFSELANVRGEGGEGTIPPRGVPNDISELAAAELETWAGDAHSITCLTFPEFFAARKRAGGDEAENTRLLDCDEGTHRLVIWFDN